MLGYVGRMRHWEFRGGLGNSKIPGTLGKDPTAKALVDVVDELVVEVVVVDFVDVVVVVFVIDEVVVDVAVFDVVVIVMDDDVDVVCVTDDDVEVVLRLLSS